MRANLPEDQGYHEAMYQFANEKPQRVFTENLNSVEATRIDTHKFRLTKPMTCRHCKRQFQTATEVGTLTMTHFGLRNALLGLGEKYPVVKLDKCPEHPNH